MKYLITESQLDRVIFIYLNNRSMIQIEKTNDIFFADSEDDVFAQIRYNKKNGLCYIYLKLIEDVSILFSLDEVNSKMLIGDWVGNTLQREVTHSQWVVRNKSEILKVRPN